MDECKTLPDGLVIVDPSVKEEMVIGSDLVVVLNAHNELCAIQKGGGCAVAPGVGRCCLKAVSASTEQSILRCGVSYSMPVGVDLYSSRATPLMAPGFSAWDKDMIYCFQVLLPNSTCGTNWWR